MGGEPGREGGLERGRLGGRGQRLGRLVPHREEEIGIGVEAIEGRKWGSRDAVTRERRIGPGEICARHLHVFAPRTLPHDRPNSTARYKRLVLNAVVLHGPKDLRLEERTLWPPQYNYAQVSVVSTGLCGSDLHYYLHGRNGDFALQAPLVLGHEAGGIVTAVGPGVKHLVPGQRVAIEAGIMCNHCDYCKKGRYNLCKSMRFCSSAKTFPHLDGTLQSRMNHPANVLHPLPDSCSFDQAALAEPLSVLLHASRRADLTSGQTVLVFGVGSIGLLACALAKSYGASHIVAIDINQTRLDFAKANGFASQIHCLPAADKAKTTEEQLRRAKENIQVALTEFGEEDGFDVVFECTGAESCIQMAIHGAITGGKVMLVGMGSRNVMLPLSAAATREVDVHGSFRYANTYPTALALLTSGKLKNVEKIITHRFPLEDTARAFDLLARGKDDEGKMVLKIMIGDS